LFKPGDVIKVKDIEGEVMSMSLVETILKVKGDTVYIPNSVLTKNEIIKKEKLKRNKNHKKKHKKR
jgi:small-conductance mechanosensitive channel